MQIKTKSIENAIKKKFIRPLNDGCRFNVAKLNNEKKTKHNETVSLLTQANKTLQNVEYNLNNYNLVDAQTLLRAAFEYIMMGMMIQFDEQIYDEFIMIGIERDKTKVEKIIGKFRTYMNDICEDFYKPINRNDKLKLLNELYDKMCKFTHSTLIVSTTIEIKSEKEKEIFKLLAFQNYYYLKILLFFCLQYFNHDKKHYLDLKNIGFTYLFNLVEINDKINKSNVDYEKYKDLLHLDENAEYFNKDDKDGQKLNDEILELQNEFKENPEPFVNELIEFLN